MHKWVFMLEDCHHMHPMWHLFLIKEQGTSCLIFMLSLRMISQQCHIFAVPQLLLTEQNLYVLLLRLKCMLKSKMEPGNQFRTWKSNREIFWAKAKLNPLLIEIVREWKTRMHSLIAVTNGNLLRMSLVLNKRSITPLLL